MARSANVGLFSGSITISNSAVEGAGTGGSSTLSGLQDVSLVSPANGDVLYRESNVWTNKDLTVVAPTLDSKKVKTNALDTLEGFLADKVVAGAGITLNVVTTGQGKKIEINAA